MTGAYLRVKRNSCWENVEVEHLTTEEREAILGSREPAEIMRWLDLVCRKLSFIEKEHFVQVES